VTTKQIIERFLEAVTRGADWTSFLAEDVVFGSMTSPGREIRGKEASLPGLRRFYSMVSSLEVRDIIVDGEKACALTRYKLKPPTGGAVFQSDVAEIFTVRDDKIKFFAIYFDTAPYPK
jgi:ketosteroid isomerase-like protein